MQPNAPGEESKKKALAVAANVLTYKNRSAAALHDRLLADPKLAKLARSSDPQIFTESIFPKAFDTAAQDSYLEAQDTFSSLFEDTSKYKAIMSALAEWLYGEFRKK